MSFWVAERQRSWLQICSYQCITTWLLSSHDYSLLPHITHYHYVIVMSFWCYFQRHRNVERTITTTLEWSLIRENNYNDIRVIITNYVVIITTMLWYLQWCAFDANKPPYVSSLNGSFQHTASALQCNVRTCRQVKASWPRHLNLYVPN